MALRSPTVKALWSNPALSLLFPCTTVPVQPSDFSFDIQTPGGPARDSNILSHTHSHIHIPRRLPSIFKLNFKTITISPRYHLARFLSLDSTKSNFHATSTPHIAPSYQTSRPPTSRYHTFASEWICTILLLTALHGRMAPRKVPSSSLLHGGVPISAVSCL